MESSASVRFFDAQFQRQVREGDLRLDPFEEATLPHHAGRVLDCGCGPGFPAPHGKAKSFATVIARKPPETGSR